MEDTTMQGATLAVLFHFVCVAFASRRVKVIVHTKPPEQSEFQCHNLRYIYTIPSDTYIDVLAYNSEPCTCWFRTSDPGSTVHTRVLHEGRYQCFRDFVLFRTFVEYQGCTDRRSGYPGSMLAASSLIVRVSREGIAVMENGTEGGLVNTSISFEVPAEAMTSLRLQATSAMALTCGIAGEGSASTDIISPPPNPSQNKPSGSRITNNSPPTFRTIKPPPSNTKPNTTHTGLTKTERNNQHNQNNQRTTERMVSGLDSTTHVPELSVGEWNNGNNGTWWNGAMPVILDVVRPVMIGTFCGGAGLVVIMLVIICLVEKRRSRKKTVGEDGVTYHGVNTDANDNMDKTPSQHQQHLDNTTQHQNIVNNVASDDANKDATDEATDDAYQFRPIACPLPELESAPDHAVSVQRPRGVYPKTEKQACGDGLLLHKANGGSDGLLLGEARGDGTMAGKAIRDGKLKKANGNSHLDGVDGLVLGKANGDGLLMDKADVVNLDKAECTGLLVNEANDVGDIDEASVLLDEACADKMPGKANGDGLLLDKANGGGDLNAMPGERTMSDKARGDGLLLDEADGDLDDSIATILNDVFTEFHPHQSTMPPKFPIHIPE